MLETMDIYVIAFVLAVITGPWQLSYGQSAAILYASGIGAVIGSFFWGYLADHIGRKKAFIGTIITCSGASLILAFTPTGDWIFLAVMRTIIGFGQSRLCQQLCLNRRSRRVAGGRTLRVLPHAGVWLARHVCDWRGADSGRYRGLLHDA
jgi:putative MFS transporter